MSDLTKKVIGFRGWTVSRGEHGLILGSTGIGGEWKPGINEAKCKKDYEAEAHNRMLSAQLSMSRFSTGSSYDVPKPLPWFKKFHAAPHPGCDCGFYAVHELKNAERWNGVQSVLGAVTAWGRMEVHRKGFRAQYIQPVLIALPDEVAKDYPYAAELLRECAARYGCGIVRPDELEKAAQQFGQLVPENLKPEPPPETRDLEKELHRQKLRYQQLQTSSALSAPGTITSSNISAGSVMYMDPPPKSSEQRGGIFWPTWSLCQVPVQVGLSAILGWAWVNLAFAGLFLLISLIWFFVRWLDG